MCLVTWHEFVFCSVPKHRIGTKRHRVCLEVPQEVSESEAFPKEELSSMQDEEDAAEPCERATGEVTQQSEQGHKVPGNCVKLYLGTAGPSVSVSREAAELNSVALSHSRLVGRLLSHPNNNNNKADTNLSEPWKAHQTFTVMRLKIIVI